MNESIPLLEYDPTREAMIEPSRVIQPRDVPEHCVLCFFREVLEQVVSDNDARVIVENRWEDGPHTLYEITFDGRRLAFCHPGVGAPLAAGILEEIIAYGCRKFIACGGCGVLEKELTVGHLVIVSAAVRDEGASYHYLPAGREVTAHPVGIAALEAVITRKGLPYRLGKTWTTDAPYRETAGKVAARRQEGCLTVEMEAAAFLAVAQYRSVILGQVLYGGDDLSGDVWDSRGWHTHQNIRNNLFWLAVEACLEL